MNLGASLNQAIEILKRNRGTIATVSKDDQALVPGLIFQAAVGLIGGLVNGIGAAIASAVLLPIFSFIGIGIMFILAKIFKGQGGYMELWRPMAFAYVLMVVNILSFIPVVGALVACLVLLGLVVGGAAMLGAMGAASAA